MCFGIGAALFLVYDSLILPLWLVLTNQWPSTADAAGTNVNFIQKYSFFIVERAIIILFLSFYFKLPS